MKYLIHLCFVLVISHTFVFSTTQAAVVSAGKNGWTHQLDLIEKDGIKIQWKSVPSNDSDNPWLVMEVEGKTNGYVGVGFSPHGGMSGADIVIGWVDANSKPHIRDFHGIVNGMPILDESQDYTLLEASEKENWTTVQFKRKWRTCDDAHDKEIVKDTMRLIWALGPNDPVLPNSGPIQMQMHGIETRGSKSVYVTDDALSTPFPDDHPELFPNVKSLDVRMNNITVGPDASAYLCQIYKFPSEHLHKKHHMIGFKPILHPGNEANVHHMNFYECVVPGGENSTENVFEPHVNQKTEKCYSKNMPPEWANHCVTFLFVWVTGSEGEMMPKHVGAPLGERHGGATYFLVEIHYDNPGLKTFKDTSGVRLFFTDKLRENDGGVLLFGYRITPFLLVPPKQPDFALHGICASECTEMALPKTGIHIVNTLLHGHLSMRKLRLRHFRNGTELPKVAEDNNYDFNYQQSKALKKEITVLPGDELITECQFDSMNNDRVILGGLSTKQEMCQTFFIYYPKIDLMQCTSQVEFHSFFEGLGMNKVEGNVLEAIKMPYNPNTEDEKYSKTDIAEELVESGSGENFRSLFDHIKIAEPSNLKNLTVGQRLRNMDWTDTKMAKKVEKIWQNGKHYAYCVRQLGDRYPLKEYIIPYTKIEKPLLKPDLACRKEGLAQSAVKLTLTSSASNSTAYVASYVIATTLLTFTFLRYLH